MKRRYTYRPDLPDQRDHYFVPRSLPEAGLPAVVDLRGAMSKVEDQGQLGSCTANAAVALVEYLDRRGDGHYRNYSRLFVYYFERVLEGTVGQDAGAFIRDAVKALAKYGVCYETEWPYAVGKFRVKPSAAALRSAATRKAVEYARVNQAAPDLCDALAQGLPVEFGFTVYTSFESAEVARTGVVPLPGKAEAALGGHAVVIVGYDAAAQTFLCRNSWGAGWGQAGYFTLPFAYVLDGDLAEDFWVVRRVAQVK